MKSVAKNGILLGLLIAAIATLTGCVTAQQVVQQYNVNASPKALVHCANGVVGASWNAGTVSNAISSARQAARTQGGQGCQVVGINGLSAQQYHSRQARNLDRSNRENTPANNQTSAEPESSPKLFTSGTGFFINRDGDVITNQHVVDGCAFVTVYQSGTSFEASVKKEDAQNDLALIATVVDYETDFARLGVERKIRLGESVVTLGYPLSNVLSSYPKVTEGTVSSLAGIRDDTRYLQISAPIQPGNSGGPLLNSYGAVIGVVTATLNAKWAAQATGTLPQNVNFAIKAGPLNSFLDTSQTRYANSSRLTKRLDTPDIIEVAQAYVVRVSCWK